MQEGAPNLLACCIFAHAASNGSFVEGNRQISQVTRELAKLGYCSISAFETTLQTLSQEENLPSNAL